MGLAAVRPVQSDHGHGSMAVQPQPRTLEQWWERQIVQEEARGIAHRGREGQNTQDCIRGALPAAGAWRLQHPHQSEVYRLVIYSLTHWLHRMDQGFASLLCLSCVVINAPCWINYEQSLVWF